VLPTLGGTEKPGAGLEKGNGYWASLQSLTVTAVPLSFFNVMVLPLAPFHPLLHTFLSLIDLPFGFRPLGAAALPETIMETQLFGG
jgi:hypothetical protein